MRKLILIVLLLLLVAACRNGDSAEDTGGGETLDTQPAEVGDESPRVEDTPAPPTPTSLPATSTPVPEIIPEHINPAETRIIHVIQPGDTLSEIALQYGVSVDAIADANRNYNFDLIFAGDTIYIPECEPEKIISKGSLNLITETNSGSSDSGSSESSP